MIQATKQQRAFLDELRDGAGHIALVARAGCGKTSTILMGVDEYAAARPSAEILVLAYNKAIADEVKEKLTRAGHNNWRTVQAATLHSMGFGLLKFVFKPTIDDKKVRNMVRESNLPACQEYGAQVVDLVRYAKQAGVGFFPDLPVASVQVWHDLADHYDVNGLDDTDQMEAVVDAAQSIYRQSLADTQTIDFDDMILLPLIKNLRVKFTKDLIFLDEAQDLSRARQALARKFLKPGTGRMVVVGDDRQAIYGFSGADAAALDNLTEQLGAERLPLSVTWRCPKAVVEVARGMVPDIEAAPGAPEGEVLRVEEVPGDLKVGDAVLCRNTAPLIDLAYRLIRNGVPAKVEGRAIGEGLKALALRWRIKTIDALLTRLDDYQAREQSKALAKGNEQKAQEVEDRVQTLAGVCRACTEAGKVMVADVVQFIDDLFADGEERAVVLATYHRSKGREWDRVVLFEHAQRCPSKMAKQAWQKEQEANLAYVAVTRARQTLVFAG